MSKIKAKLNGICLPSQLKTRLSSVFVAIWRVRRRIFFVGEVVAIVVGVGSGRSLELMQSASGDIYKSVERRNVHVMAGKGGDYSEHCNWMVEDRPIEFGDDVGTTLVLQYDDEWTEISRMHFAIQGLLDGGISDEDKVAKLEVVHDDGGGMLLFKMDGGFDSSSVDVRGECCQVRLVILQGDGALSNKVSQGKRGVGGRKQIGCFSDVEGQKWMCAGHCKVRGAAHTSADCDSVSPHDGSDNGVPPRLVSIAGLE